MVPNYTLSAHPPLLSLLTHPYTFSAHPPLHLLCLPLNPSYSLPSYLFCCPSHTLSVYPPISYVISTFFSFPSSLANYKSLPFTHLLSLSPIFTLPHLHLITIVTFQCVHAPHKFFSLLSNSDSLRISSFSYFKSSAFYLSPFLVSFLYYPYADIMGFLVQIRGISNCLFLNTGFLPNVSLHLQLNDSTFVNKRLLLTARQLY